MLAVVSGLIGSYPLGGMAAHYLQYVLGLRRLGFKVLYLEDTGRWAYQPEQGTFTQDAGYNVSYMAKLMEQRGLSGAWAFRSFDGNYHGLSGDEVFEACRSADLFLNISGSCWLRPEYRACKRVVYLDTDPGYDQFKVASVVHEGANGDYRYSVERMAEHDHHFTFGENVGKANCRLPTDLFSWRPTRQPILLELWKEAGLRHRDLFTTVLSWDPYGKPFRAGGREYSGKEVHFRRILGLPGAVGTQFELALSGRAPTGELESNGWRIAEAQKISHDLDSYRAYIQSSKGELSVAKEIYVATWSGWFSERSACYLASGRPVIVQDTGFSDFFPTDLGLCAFSDQEEAAQAIRRVNGDYERHCKAARAIAEEYFDSDKVLGKLLREVGL